MRLINTLLVAAVLASAPTLSCVKPQETLTPEDQSLARVERVLLITQIAVDRAHVALWSGPLRAKVAECTSSNDIPGCMGHFNPESNRKVVRALEVYKEAAEAAGEAVLQGQGEGNLRSLISECAEAALAFLSLIPNSERYTAPVKKAFEALQ